MTGLPIISEDDIFVNDHKITFFGKDSVGKILFPNENFSLENTKSGTAIAARNVRGQESEIELHIIRGTEDDRYLQNILDAQFTAIDKLTPLSFTLIKRYADGIKEEYYASNGVFTHNIEVESNMSGDVSQNVAVYKMKFGQFERKYV